MRRALGIVGLLTVWVLLPGCEPPPASAVRAPIVDGTLEMDEPAVVTVTAFGALGLCTGTLIAPSVVLTAKHCVQAPGASEPYPVTAMTVGVGYRADDVVEHRVRYVGTTEGVYMSDPRTGIAGALVGVDVGVVILREPVEGVTPIPIRRDRPDDLVGQPFTAIGFGQRPDGPAGLKYKTTGTLGDIVGTVLFTAQVICSGDSGGPMIQETPERRVVGVASFGEAGACPSSRDGYNALFEHLGVIDRALVLAGECVDLGAEECNSVDDDCDGSIDEGCAPLGAACEADSDCAFAQLPAYLDPLDDAAACEDLGSGLVCTRPCAIGGSGCGTFAHFVGDGVDTVEGAFCRPAAGCEGRCAVGETAGAADGAACGADIDCASFHCADPGDGERRCLPPCRAGQGACAVGEVCVPSADACGSCLDGGRVSGARGLGEPCGGDAECAGAATCVSGECATACGGDGDCVSGYRCESGRCVRGGRATTGEPCATEEDCVIGDACGDGGYCTHACTSDAMCPAGLSCDGATCATGSGVLGASCGADGECLDGLCDDGCTRSCGLGVSCPVGFACTRDGDGDARCRRVGGCAVSLTGSGAPAWLPWLLAALAVTVLRRRRDGTRAQRPCVSSTAQRLRNHRA